MNKKLQKENGWTLWMILFIFTFGLGACGLTDDDGADESNVDGLSLLVNLAGTYDVTDAITGTHNRNNLTITTAGNIDFDAEISFSATQIQTIYDRISCCSRIQVSYGADDDFEVINLFIDGSQNLERVQFRHRNENINVEVNVVKR